jgi:hypothetical protein
MVKRVRKVRGEQTDQEDQRVIEVKWECLDFLESMEYRVCPEHQDLVDIPV